MALKSSPTVSACDFPLFSNNSFSFIPFLFSSSDSHSPTKSIPLKASSG